MKPNYAISIEQSCQPATYSCALANWSAALLDASGAVARTKINANYEFFKSQRQYIRTAQPS
jgi:hypothetical protein